MFLINNYQINIIIFRVLSILAYFKTKKVNGQSTTASTAPAGCEYNFLNITVIFVDVFG